MLIGKENRTAYPAAWFWPHFPLPETFTDFPSLCSVCMPSFLSIVSSDLCVLGICSRVQQTDTKYFLCISEGVEWETRRRVSTPSLSNSDIWLIILIEWVFEEFDEVTRRAPASWFRLGKQPGRSRIAMTRTRTRTKPLLQCNCKCNPGNSPSCWEALTPHLTSHLLDRRRVQLWSETLLLMLVIVGFGLQLSSLFAVKTS
jgi:hypothetical protein